MQKLFCYVDESGQDTAAQLGRKVIFVVAVAVFSEDRNDLEMACLQYEKASGKKKKWNSTKRLNRLNYIRLILHDERFRRTLCFSISAPVLHPDFDARTILSIAQAITWKNPLLPYTAEVYVDGLTKDKQSGYATALRKTGLRGVRRVHRARDESYPLLRLADALAGFVREALEGKDVEIVSLLQEAQRRGMMSEL